jgi:hypothetical protein
MQLRVPSNSRRRVRRPGMGDGEIMPARKVRRMTDADVADDRTGDFSVLFVDHHIMNRAKVFAGSV